jgi:putative tricarboxylic transport membrane protein
MRLKDAAAGALIAILGIAVAAYSRTFPPMPGQSVGPALFPAALGCGLALLGGTLVFSRRAERAAPWVVFDEWTGTRSAVFRFALVVAALVFYAGAAERLGFFITGIIFLTVLLFAFGVPRRHIAPLAIGVPIAIHYAFYTLLRVPLPWGLLERFAW